MEIGRNSFKAAKEKAKAAGKKIRDAKPQHFMSKSFARIPSKGVNEIKPAGINKSPANGNAFTGKQAKLDKNNNGEIDAEDFKILQARRDSAANYKNYGVSTSPTMMDLMGRGTKPKKDPTKDPNFGVSPKVLPKTSQQNFNELVSLPNAVTQPVTPKAKPTKSKEKVIKKKVNEGTVSTSSGFSSLTKAPKIGENMVEQSSRKIDLVSSSRPQTRQEARLAKTKAKAAEARTKTNQTIKSIDISKPKSADTEAKQISASRSRAKTKRLENRASRIEGRMERKASRQAQHKKIKGNK